MVAHEHRRPFLVQVGPSTITAVGTSFNIEYLDARMKLDMVEGRVLVAVAGPSHASGSTNPTDPSAAASDSARARSAPEESTPRPLDLSAGEELTVAPGGEAQLVHNADIAAAIAWRDGKIIFKNTPLGDAVRRLNRYSLVQLRIGDPALAQERINGVFQLDDALVFADAIESTLGVQAHRIGSRELLLSPAR
jgi:transmembrane sensor